MKHNFGMEHKNFHFMSFHASLVVCTLCFSLKIHRSFIVLFDVSWIIDFLISCFTICAYIGGVKCEEENCLLVIFIVSGYSLHLRLNRLINSNRSIEFIQVCFFLFSREKEIYYRVQRFSSNLKGKPHL